MKTIIVEVGVGGHRIGYVSHIMRYIASNPAHHGKYTFLLNKWMKNAISPLLYTSAYTVKFIEFSGDASANRIAEWKYIAQNIDELYPYKEVIFLEIDRYLLLLFLWNLKRSISIRGILFQPYIHYKHRKGSWWFFLRHQLKSYALQKVATVFNSSINKLYILNDRDCPEVMNKSIKNIFHYIPDPIDTYSIAIDPGKAAEITSKYGICHKKRKLLLFGSIDHRKNLLNILHAIHLLPEKERKRIHLIIAGRFNVIEKPNFINHIKFFQKEYHITYHDEYTTAEEREILFQNSDLVLMPYINFYGSSGNLGHTIKYTKPVIVSKEGLISKIVTDNNIGLTVNPLNRVEISNAIQNILNKTSAFQYDNNKFLDEYSPSLFSKTLLSA